MVDHDVVLPPHRDVCFPLADGAVIERYVPVLPLSQDVGRLDALLASVASYRLAFGQTRQEELLRLLEDRLSPADLEEVTERLRVDLRPVNA